MSVLDVVKLPTPSLRDRSIEVDHLFLERADTREFIKDLIETMYADDGIGIAAPQVGNNVRICIIGKDAVPGKKKDLVLVNPVWEKTSKKSTSDTEGCLSVPGVFGTVKRWKDITVTAMDENGKPTTFQAKNFFARVIQHEVDHLNGVLFIDKATGIYKVDRKESRL